MMSEDNVTEIDGSFTMLPNTLLDALESGWLTRTEVIVYWVLKSHENRKTGEAFPGYETLMRKTGLSTAPLSKAIRGLDSKGWLERRKRFNNSAIYRLKSSSPLESKEQSFRNESAVLSKLKANQIDDNHTECKPEEQKEQRCGKSALGVLEIPSWEAVCEYGHSRKPKIPVETLKAFFITNRDNDWKAIYNKRLVPIRNWKMALDGFAKTDRKRVTGKETKILHREFWGFVNEMDADSDDARAAANTWIRFMEKRDWKIPDRVTRTPMPVKDFRKAFTTWYQNTWQDFDTGLNRQNWDDSCLYE